MQKLVLLKRQLSNLTELIAPTVIPNTYLLEFKLALGK